MNEDQFLLETRWAITQEIIRIVRSGKSYEKPTRSQTFQHVSPTGLEKLFAQRSFLVSLYMKSERTEVLMLKAAIQGKKKDLEKAHGYDIQENEELDVFM